MEVAFQPLVEAKTMLIAQAPDMDLRKLQRFLSALLGGINCALGVKVPGDLPSLRPTSML